MSGTGPGNGAGLAAGTPAGRARRFAHAAAGRLAATGPWPRARVLRAALALGVAAALATLSAGVDPRVAPLLGLPAFAGVALMAVALARDRTEPLTLAVVLLGVPSAVAVAGGSVALAATAGAGLVAVHELARWSVERRVEPAADGDALAGAPGARAGEGRRWIHLAAVLLAGWLVGVALVTLASGRVLLAAWHALLVGVAAVVVAGSVALLIRSRP